jgi:glycosyl transferase family 87
MPKYSHLSAEGPQDIMRPRAVLTSNEPLLSTPKRTLWRRTLLASFIVFYLGAGFVLPMAIPWSFDLAINYSAATLVRTRTGNIYDPQALRYANDHYIGVSKAHDLLYKNTFGSYINPPTTAILLVPLSLLPFTAARIVFLLLNHALYLGAIALCLQTLNARWSSPATRVVVQCALLCSPATVSFFHGQADAFILFAFTMALRAALCARNGRAGAWIAAAAAIKGTPLLVLGFFAVRRKWSALAGAAVALMLCTLAEIAIVGQGTLRYFMTQVLPVVGKGSAFFQNQSLLGLMYRFVTPWSALVSLDAMPDHPWVRLVWATMSLSIFAITVVLVARASLDRPAIAGVAFGAFILVAVLVGAISWDHYMTWAMLLVVAVVIDWFETRWLAPRRFWTLFSIGAGLMLCPIVAQLVGTLGMLVLLGLVWSRLGSSSLRVA